MFGVRLSKMGSASKLGLVAKAIGILRKYGTDAHVYLPGIGTVSGLTAGNYLDSAGTTAATVDNPVGLSLDALQAMTLGSELWNPAAVTLGTGWTRDADVFTTNGTNANITLSALTIGKTYKFSAVISGGSLNLFLGGATFVLGATGTYTWTGSAAGDDKIYAQNSTVGAKTVSVSVREIPGIHATQSTTANKALLKSAAGKYWWQLDGTDSLSLSAPLFQMSDDHVVIAGFNASAVGVYVFSHTNTSTGVHCATVRVASDGKPSAWWRDDSTAQDVLYGPSSIVGSAAVVTAKKAASAKSLRVNGSLASSAGTSLGTTTLNEYAIGKSGAGYMQGSIYPVIAIKGTLSDSDLLVLERFVGQLSGVQI